MEFLDEFDELLASEGPPAVFTLNYEGCLQFDLLRSRDISRQNPNAVIRGFCHCVYIDHATSWPQYLLVTSPELCLKHDRAKILRFDTFEEAVAHVEKTKKALFKQNQSRQGDSGWWYRSPRGDAALPAS